VGGSATILGVRRAATIAVFGLSLAAGCNPSADQCGGFCGASTICEADRCVVAPPPPSEAEPEAEEPKGKKRRRRRGGKRKDSAAHGSLPDKDGHIPRYRADRVEQIGEGSERLPDRKVRQELATIEPAFNRCLARASEVTDTALAGTVSFKVGIESSGKVWGINAKLPSSWGVDGLRACFRKAIFGHRFPRWDGPAMGVDYHFQVD